MQTDDTDVGVGPIEADDGKRSVEEIVQHMHEAATANATDPRASEEEKRVWTEHIELCTELRRALKAADRARKPGEPIGYALQSVRDGSILQEFAWCRWTTFENDMDKLRAHPWFVNGAAKIAPLYVGAVVPDTAQEEEVTHAALCTLCGDLVAEAEQAQHCAGHAHEA